MGIPWGPSVAFLRRNQYMLLRFFREAQPPSHTPWAHRSTSPIHISASACPITSVLSPKRTPLLSAIYWRHLLVCARASSLPKWLYFKDKIDLLGAERASPNHHNSASAGPISSVLSPKITPLLSDWRYLSVCVRTSSLPKRLYFNSLGANGAI